MEFGDDIVWQCAEDIMRTAAPCVEFTVRGDAPRDTGQLLSSIKADRPKRVGNTVEFTLTQDEGLAPHGNIIDKSTGRTIFAKDYGKRAFGPITGGPNRFLGKVTLSTEHRGWWSDYDFGSAFDSCLR